MKLRTRLLLVLILTPVACFGDGPNPFNSVLSYMTKMSFSIGYASSTNQAPLVGNDFNQTMRMIDGFGDKYYLSLTADEVNSPVFPLGFSWRVPLFFATDNDTFGLQLGGQVVRRMIGVGHAGLYYERTFNRFAVAPFFGISGSSMSKSTNLQPAFSGDPGYFTGTDFIKPGSEYWFQGTSGVGLSVGVAAKFYILKWLFAEGEVSYYSPSRIDTYSLHLGKNTLPVTGFATTPLSGGATFSIRVGIGGYNDAM